MRRGVVIIGAVFAVALAVAVGSRMSADAMSVVIGVACGMLASVPTSLVLLWVLARRGPGADRGGPAGMGSGYFPPVVVVNPGPGYGAPAYGGMAQALGYGICEQMLFDGKGRVLNPRFDDYRILRADEMPQMTTIFVETHEPSHPFGVKAVAEIPMDGVAPAVANAVYDAVGVRVKDLPLTPEKVWRAARHGF